LPSFWDDGKFGLLTGKGNLLEVNGRVVVKVLQGPRKKIGARADDLETTSRDLMVQKEDLASRDHI
jgi:hypothetical protein